MTGSPDPPDDILPALGIPPSALALSFIRASGPGGQNVNKVATAAQLRFDAAGSGALTPAELARLRRLAGRRMTAAGVVVITARRFRTQERNREDAIERLADLLRAARTPPRTRRPTRPGKAARERRLTEKKRRGETKRLRGRSPANDG